MDKLEMTDYYSLAREDRNYIDEFINNLNVRIITKYEGLTENFILEILNTSDDMINEVLDDIRKLRIYNGYKPISLNFTDEGLLIEENTIKNEEDFMEVLANFTRPEEKIFNISDLNQESIEKINSIVREKRISIYEDITPEFLDMLIEKNDIVIGQIFKIFRKISVIKGYRVIEILLSEKGLKVEQEAIKNENEYKELLKMNNISIG